MEYKPLDKSLITSEVCIRCGHCCKWTSTTQLMNGPGPEWLDVVIGTNPYLKMNKHNKRDVKMPNGKFMGRATPFEIEFRCPKLKTNEEGHKLCSIYENRPKICSNYNCFEASNQAKRRPENFAQISEIIKEVHGVEVKYENPLVNNNKVGARLEQIGVVEIK